MDLSKMSVDDLHIQHRKAWTQDEWERSFACFDELARRLAAADAENDHLLFTLDRIINAVPCIDPNDGTFFVCHFDEDGNEIGVTHFQEGQIVDQILKIVRGAAQHARNAGGGRDE